MGCVRASRSECFEKRIRERAWGSNERGVRLVAIAAMKSTGAISSTSAWGRSQNLGGVCRGDESVDCAGARGEKKKRRKTLEAFDILFSFVA